MAGLRLYGLLPGFDPRLREEATTHPALPCVIAAVSIHASVKRRPASTHVNSASAAFRSTPP